MLNKNRNYTQQQLAFLEALMGPEAEGDLRKAMTLAGYSDNTPISEIKRSLKEEIIDLALNELASSTPEAVMALKRVLKEPNQLGAGTRLKAVAQILDRAGIVKPEGDLNLKVPEGGLIILPAKKKSTDDSITIDTTDVGEAG